MFNGGAYSNGGSYTYSVVAANGGVVDLSEVTTLTGAASDDWLRLRATSGGTILLGKVPQTTGRVWFDIDDTGTLDLSALQAVAGGGQFTLGTGATLALPELLAINGVPSRWAWGRISTHRNWCR